MTDRALVFSKASRVRGRLARIRDGLSRATQARQPAGTIGTGGRDSVACRGGVSSNPPGGYPTLQPVRPDLSSSDSCD